MLRNQLPLTLEEVLLLKEIKKINMKDNFKISDKELLDARNTIFKNYDIPELEKNGYVKSPFKTSWFGQLRF